MSVTAAEVSEKVAEFEESREDREKVYEELHWGENVEIPELGLLEHVDSYGGEGQGDDYWVVFKLGDQLFRVDGWYASYDGGELDGELYEVVPKPIQRVEYVKK